MAAAVGRFWNPKLLQPRQGNYMKQVHSFSTASWWNGKKNFLLTVGALVGGTGALFYTLDCSVKASDLIVKPPKMTWGHSGIFNSYDHASIRRGYEVYKQVCSACHSMTFMYYRKLVGVCLTEEEAKRDAQEQQIKDGPDSTGEYFLRPGKLSDKFPSPYPNEEAARFANNGALPPDLSRISSARHGKDNYIFHLLTSYFDPPAGHNVGEGQFYNPYFPGGNIGMAKALYDDIIEYEDGTPATTSQLAKDVSTFLRWSSEPEMDTRKFYFIKFLLFWPPFLVAVWYYYRYVWAVLKTRKIVFSPPPKRLQ